MTISFILLTTIIFNPREFHNFYRSSTYEEFIRLKFSEERGIVADVYIDKYKQPDRIKADKLLREAWIADSLKEYERALCFYNKSIDQYPDNAHAYFLRGYLKLNRLDINNDMAISAIKDFSKAIRINPEFTDAYFQRGLAWGYIGNTGKSLVDRKKVWEADSSLSDDVFLKKYGSLKESFFIPFNP
jgi:tetratricopeptide (TPR) repeat protein